MDVIKRCAEDILYYITKYTEESQRLGFIESVVKNMYDRYIPHINETVLKNAVIQKMKDDVKEEQLIAINDLADEKFEKYVSELEDTSLGELIQLYKEKYVYSDND